MVNNLFKEYEIEDYPEINEKEIKFPNEIYISYAVCAKECGRKEFIVDGSTQVCQKCGGLMFRTETKKYKLIDTE